MLCICYFIAGFGIGGSYTIDGNVFLEYCSPEKRYLLCGVSGLLVFICTFPSGFALLYLMINAPYQ